MTARNLIATKPAGKARRRRSWIRTVQQTSNAMDLPPGLFRRSPVQVARGLRRAVLQSRRTKGTKLQSAMSMLNLFLNRAGRKLSPSTRTRLECAKVELRRLFARE
jgi:hypothetical protein